MWPNDFLLCSAIKQHQAISALTSSLADGRILSSLRPCSLSENFQWIPFLQQGPCRSFYRPLRRAQCCEHTHLPAIPIPKSLNPKKRKRKAPFCRSGLTRFRSYLQRIYVAKELNLHILSLSLHWSSCETPHYDIPWSTWNFRSSEHCLAASVQSQGSSTWGLNLKRRQRSRCVLTVQTPLQTQLRGH